jgi:hypothetical protein
MNDKSNTCRVCHGSTNPFFKKKVMGRHEVHYFQCGDCGHVQTETPYWLDEAYSNLNFKRDVGMADRSVTCAKKVASLSYKLSIPREGKFLDWGAGTGLMVRLCRDHGLDCYYSDRYSKNIFAMGFESLQNPLPGSYRFITAFEVAEHFPNPVEDFREILRLKPEYLLFSTLLYDNQGESWWYFTEDGQHVAFYTRRSLEVIARSFGYHLSSDNCGTHLFSTEKLGDSLINRVCKRRNYEAWSLKCRKKLGSRILDDFALMTSTPMTG